MALSCANDTCTWRKCACQRHFPSLTLEKKCRFGGTVIRSMIHGQRFRNSILDGGTQKVKWWNGWIMVFSTNHGCMGADYGWLHSWENVVLGFWVLVSLISAVFFGSSLWNQTSRLPSEPPTADTTSLVASNHRFLELIATQLEVKAWCYIGGHLLFWCTIWGHCGKDWS